MEKIWLEQYDAGVPFEINPDLFPSLPAMVLDSVARFGDRPAGICAGVEMTYRNLDRLSAAVAGWLHSVGLPKGTRVAIMLPNILQFPIASLGILRAGMIAVGCNPLYTARELEHQLKDAGVQAIITLEELSTTHADVFNRVSIGWVLTTSPLEQAALAAVAGGNLPSPAVAASKAPRSGHFRFIDVLATGLDLSPLPVDIKGTDIAYLQYTGGTTGLSKGAMLTHRNLVSNVSQILALWQPVLAELEGRSTYALGASPMYHVTGLVNFFLSLCSRRTVLLVPNPRDIDDIVKTLRRYPFTFISGTNTLLAAFLGDEAFCNLDFSSLRITTSGAMPVRREMATKWQQVTGVPVAECYGLSETTMGVAFNPLSSQEFSGTVGLPLPSTIVTIRNADGSEVAPGGVGEVCVQGPQVMKGYWNQPEETARAMTADQALRTGDVGKMDERGYLTIVDRLKDVIIVSGFNVYPSEIEAVIAAHPGVKECAVIGIGDERSGEVPKAFIVPADSTLTAAEIRVHCRKNLTGYKIPKHVEFIGELPKNNVGKVLRRALRSNV